MNYIDDNTDVLSLKVTEKRGNEELTYTILQDRRSEKFTCSVFTNGISCGTVNQYESREQVLAWLRLMLGDYEDCYRGVA